MEIKATWMRGGTSKCWVFRSQDVPADRDELSRLLVACFGSRDGKEMDGVGGATSVTSKALVIGPSSHGCDADYLFAQVGIGEAKVEYDSNCGNCATAAALWVAEQGEQGTEPVQVRLHNLNTSTVVEARVASTARPQKLDTAVPGVEGLGVAVELAFVDPAGSNTGALWPTGNAVDELEAAGRRWPVSLVDAGAPVAVTTADALGVDPGVSIAEFDTYVAELRALRRAAALAMGLSRVEDPILDSVPKIGIVGPPVDYVTTAGKAIPRGDYDLSIRMLSMLATHPAIGLTSAVALALMTLDKKSLAGMITSRDPHEGLLLGTPGGLVRVRVEQGNGHTKVYLQRAARRMADATIHVPDYQMAELS